MRGFSPEGACFRQCWGRGGWLHRLLLPATLAACVFALWLWLSIALPLVLFIYPFQDKYSKVCWASFRTLPIYTKVLWSLPCSDKFLPMCVLTWNYWGEERLLTAWRIKKKNSLFAVFDVICDFIWASWAAPCSRLEMGRATFEARHCHAAPAALCFIWKGILGPVRFVRCCKRLLYNMWKYLERSILFESNNQVGTQSDISSA